ncbi:cytochrome P450 [Streptacidiphilus sp. ASG 303]|uniref:cytochrome P450 n=1 Tax=Streptacidiphilus sp. ASG 303 TaxID=2896847 RepID=UPI001E56DE29|nr:cytochrome P450 [Streptacidiphilus sp. ASG 303]MCD0482565.1 cytochrome P450 [Streptacidiphilus sp. ASG 303]
MHASVTAPGRRATAFAPRIDALLRDHLGEDVFRLDPGTVGVASPALIDEILAARPANDFERPTFKPLQGRAIPRTEASALMRAVGQDVRAALQTPVDLSADLSGEWPHVAHNHLRDLVFGSDPYRLKVLVDRRLEWTPKLTWAVIAGGAALPRDRGTGRPASRLAAATAAPTYGERRHAMGMYRRAAAPVCFTVSALVANALWLGAPFADDVPNRHIIHESLRLLPVSWNLLRVASPEFHALDGRIGAGDDVLMLPLLSHRDPAVWDAPLEFRPERWNHLDPDDTPGYLPFGHANERCWGRHMVMPLAERLLDIARHNGLAPDPGQTTARVPLAGLMSVVGVRMVPRS